MTLLNLKNPLFAPDTLSWIMMALIVFVIANVAYFSQRYMAGDRNYRRHRTAILCLAASVMVMVFADHLLALLAGWTASNFLLARLMTHKSQWVAARNSGRLALRTFAGGLAMLAAGFWMLAETAGTASIHAMVATANEIPPARVAVPLALIALAALTQSAAWPFHRWLVSSLNSPTPVSALMHAGLVNGGGFLLVRFAPLYAMQPMLLHVLFAAGLIAAFLGTLWKLLQTDVKRMLACSTIGQMGFMIMQCGMGLFPLAVSHLVWHGLFKAYLFLSSGSAVREKRNQDSFVRITFLSLAIAGVFGFAGADTFAWATGSRFRLDDSSALMLGLAFMASCQLAANRLQGPMTLSAILAAFAASVASGALYGTSIRLLESTLAPLELFRPQPLDAIYSAGFGILFLAWLAATMNVGIRMSHFAIWKRMYVTALNGSQPHPSTITSARTTYEF